MRCTVWGAVWGEGGLWLVWGTGGGGGRGLEINKIKSKNPKTCLDFIIIYFRVGFLILLFTYVNLYLLVLLFILSFIVSYEGGG